ncbi:MAG: signal peptidase I [Planctomycetes bacterium]|nr:signal peptidase I [Planctomycetota bacterium]
MTPPHARESWWDVFLPLADHLAPHDLARAAGRARNWCVVGAIGAWLVPASPAFGTATAGDVRVLSIAFVVAAVATHMVRRRAWGTAMAVVVAVAAGMATGGGRWGVCIAGFVAATVALTHARRAMLRPGEAVGGLPGLAGIALGFTATFIFREYAALPIHVPTGSMEPTIHADGLAAQGDTLWTDRTAYLTRGPQRFDIAVFDFPLHRPTSFVKRVIGLPGESVEIRGGDIWIDGRIAQRTGALRDAMWREVFPKPNPLALPHKVAQDWAATDRSTGGGWSVEEGGVVCRPSRGRESLLKFLPRLDCPDLRLRFALDFEGQTAASVRITSRGHVAEVWVPSPAMSLQAELRVVGAAAVRFDGTPDEFYVADGFAVVRAGGRELARAEVGTESGGRNSLELAVSADSTGCLASIRGLRLDRDQVWLPAKDGTAVWHVPADSYFMLGDNAEGSDDSREWSVTEIRARGVATPFLVPVTYPADTGAPVQNLRRDGDAWIFQDVNGIPRRVLRADVESKKEGVRTPFVPRGHFLGRAVLVFWPFLEASGGLRPRFLP